MNPESLGAVSRSLFSRAESVVVNHLNLKLPALHGLGKNMGKAAAAYYKELKAGGLPEQVAVKLTEDYMRTFTNIGDMMRGSRKSSERSGEDVGEEIKRKVREKIEQEL